MSLNDPLSNVLSHIINCERIGKIDCVVRHSSKIIRESLKIIKDGGYIGDFKEIENGRGGLITINLLGNINKCGVIKPRFSVKKNQFEKYEKRYLPSKDFGLIIVSTPEGIMTHYEAKEKNIGGKLIAYVY